MKNKILSVLVLTAALVCLFTSCSDDTKYKDARVTYVSSTTLTFKAEGGAQTITVYADNTWTCDGYPDWVTVSPETSDEVVTDVTITTSAYSEGLAGASEPRTAEVTFKGITKESETILYITQRGDTYGTTPHYTLTEVSALVDGTRIVVPDVLVVAAVTDGYIVSDASNSANLFMETAESFSVGDGLTLYGDKGSKNSLATIVLDEWDVDSTGNTITYPTPTDITNNVDSYRSATWDYVCATGIYRTNNNSIVISGRTNTVCVTDKAFDVDLSEYVGEKMTLTGYYAGTASSKFNIILTDLEDISTALIYYLQEDFEWLEPWSDVFGSGDEIALNTTETSGIQEQLGKITYNGQTVLQALLAKGYDFLRHKYDDSTDTDFDVDSSDECIYWLRNYLKFGKTYYQAGIILKPLDSNPEPGAKVTLQFDWSPMMKTNDKMDDTTLTIYLTVDGKDYDIAVPEHGVAAGTMKWVTATIDLTEYGINRDSVIKIRPDQWGQHSSVNFRWFVDNIYIYTELE